MGIITEVGPGVMLLKKGDRIVLPFNVADGRCQVSTSQCVIQQVLTLDRTVKKERQLSAPA
jgi:threonine dehydrogenase-like Zn-dependent dehydrogenase